MTRTTRLFILAMALMVNGAAAAVAHVAMVQTVAREQLAQQVPARIVVNGPVVPGAVATSSCPGGKVL